MTRTTSFLAFVGCSLALTSTTILSLADDAPAGASEKTELTATAAPAANAAATPAPILYWPTTLAPVKKSNVKGVPNFGKLNEFIWRSGQPSKQGYENLKQLGLKTVVNLRKETPQDKDLLPEGVNYVFIPITDETPPTKEQAQQFLDVASNPANWPLLVHCHGGEGRAGVMSALVRYSIDGWDHDKIMKEVGTFRVAYLGFIKTKMKGSQQAFLKEWEAARPAGEYAAKIRKPAEVASNQ